jgi:hypothetical protein
MVKQTLSLNFKEVTVVKKLLEKEMREGKLYEDEQALGERIVKFINDLEGDF